MTHDRRLYASASPNAIVGAIQTQWCDHDTGDTRSAVSVVTRMPGASPHNLNAVRGGEQSERGSARGEQKPNDMAARVISEQPHHNGVERLVADVTDVSDSV